MSDIIRFQMDVDFRRQVIESHIFYIGQAKKRILSQFDNIEVEANEALDKWVEDRQRFFDPEEHDYTDFMTKANDEAINYFDLLSDMHNQTRLSIVASIFHEWEKQLRSFLTKEANLPHTNDNVRSKIWKANFDQIVELLECLGWKLKEMSFYISLDRCRRVVNVFKHGDGDTFKELKENYSEFFDYSPDCGYVGVDYSQYAAYSHLRVTDDHLNEFSGAIVKFWQDIPDNLMASDLGNLPNWFRKAFNKDINNTKGAQG